MKRRRSCTPRQSWAMGGYTTPETSSRCALVEGPADSSANTFVDDVFRFIPVFFDDCEHALAVGKQDSDPLAMATLERGYAQNYTKQETAMWFTTWECTRKLSTTDPNIQGPCVHLLIYLGASFSPTGATSQEVTRRVDTLNRGWCSLIGMWTSGAPCGVMRILFIANVYSRAISGLGAFCVTDAQSEIIDASLCKKLRCLMMGNAHWVEDGAHCTIKNDQVWAPWRLAPVGVELAVRRLGF